MTINTEENVFIWEKIYQKHKKLIDNEAKDSEGIVWSFATKEGAAQFIREPEERKRLLWLAQGITSRKCLQDAFEHTPDYYSNECGYVRYPNIMVKIEIEISSFSFDLRKKQLKLQGIIKKVSASVDNDNNKDVKEIKAEIDGLISKKSKLYDQLRHLQAKHQRGTNCFSFMQGTKSNKQGKFPHA